jgi:hypothetical protein
MPDKPRSFKEVVAAQDPAERARMENGETFNDVMVRSPFHQECASTRTATAPESGAWNTSMTTVAAMSRCLPALKPRGGRATISTRLNLVGYGPFEPSQRPG